MTLQSPIYDRLTGFGISRYRTYCDADESHCLTYGGYWTSAPTERAFGPSGEPGRLDSGLGSARWKQRAFYDFLKDLAPLTKDLAISRVSVWEEIQVGPDSRCVGDVLDEATRCDATWQTPPGPASCSFGCGNARAERAFRAESVWTLAVAPPWTFSGPRHERPLAVSEAG